MEEKKEILILKKYHLSEHFEKSISLGTQHFKKYPLNFSAICLAWYQIK